MILLYISRIIALPALSQNARVACVVIKQINRFPDMESLEAEPGSRKRGRYAFLKCDQCRKDKQKVIPSFSSQLRECQFTTSYIHSAYQQIGNRPRSAIGVKRKALSAPTAGLLQLPSKRPRKAHPTNPLFRSACRTCTSSPCPTSFIQ